MKTLAFHEAIPGHHFQIALNLENKDLSFFRKHGVNSTAYTEGWALYAEQLAVEIGLSENPYDKIGMLKILELRQNTKDFLGTRFDIRDFHNFILENGEVPLTVLEDTYKIWLKDKS